MAAIRQVLAAVDNDADPAPEAETQKPSAPSAPRAPVRLRDGLDESDDGSKLRFEPATKAAGASARFDVAGLRRSHDKRVKKFLRSEARRKKSGAFLTGFTLVTMVAATLFGLYVLQPQIIAASPGMAPAMTEYVETVDRYRVATHERTAEWSGWLDKRVTKLADRME